ncbi:MAG: matrixin family metalloprotease [Candidatus Moranbacteria bacterium]|nr:matrixin family metalloprotease [Candidatus Moranbacteria bacterium]
MDRDTINRFSRLAFLCILGGVSIGTALFFAPDMFSLQDGRPGCDTPIHWRLGDVDSRFPLDRDAFLRTVIRAEGLWEQPLGKELFVYDPDASFVITTFYDDRQKMTYDTRNLEKKIDQYNRSAETLRDAYDAKLSAFERDQEALSHRMREFESDLSAYNADVSRANASGGASPETYDALEKKRKKLEKERSAINKESERLGKMADEVNATAGKLNIQTASVQQNLTEYRRKYGEPKPFIQGLYEAPLTSITIYQFEGKDDLRLVLAHELGHALGIDEHVQDDQSAIMYAMIGGQDLENPTLTQGDEAAYETACPAEPESGRDALVRYLIETPFSELSPRAAAKAFRG